MGPKRQESSVEPENKNPHISKISALVRKPRRQRALEILHEIAMRVEPLMKQYHFKVGQFVEFWPKQKNLLGLNVNMGQKICVRLRYPNDENQFLPMDDIMGTMLHELTHNVRGPHDSHFYEKLGELSARQRVIDEKQLYLSFRGVGRKVGGSALPLQRLAREKPEKKQFQVESKRLGGMNIAPSGANKTARQLAAIAAQRRAQDSIWCGGSHADAQAPNENELITIIIDDNMEVERRIIEISDDDEPKAKRQRIEVIDLTEDD